MTPEHWKRISSLLDAVLALPPEERSDYLSHRVQDDELRLEVEGLLLAFDRADSFLEEPAIGYAPDLLDEVPPSSIAGRRIGAYRVLRPIASGGMGSVFLAARDDDQFEQKVAVKVVREGAETDEARQRFYSERQILARLEHPGIARLLDGGLTGESRPYFVMEYVRGLPIDRYCDENRLTVRDRLSRFLDVCDAVQYAHQNLIVHRDLKPANILVTGEGRVKLLDFGIAKVLEGGGDGGPAHLTRTGMRVLTPAYAAPEQLLGEGVTTATDVYALGVLLFQLLTGRHPYRLNGESEREIEQAVLGGEPMRPSAAVTASGSIEASTATARARGTNTSALRRQLSGDLDVIILRALHRVPSRRYPTAEALSDDLRRYLAGRPVRAQKDTLWYRAEKFTRRHAGPLAASVLFVAMLAGFAWNREEQVRRIALERNKAEQVSAFLVDLFRHSDPEQVGADPPSVLEIAERGARRVETELADQPELQAQMSSVLGTVYRSLGRYDLAAPLLERSLALNRTIHGSSDPATAAAMVEFADLLCMRGEYEAALPLYDYALAVQRTALGDKHLQVAATLTNYSGVLFRQGDHDGSESLYRDALEIRRAQLAENHPDVAESRHNLAAILHTLGRYEESEALFRLALDDRRAAFGEVHPAVAATQNYLAMVLEAKKEYEEAEVLYRKALDARRELYETAHPDIGISLNNLATLYRRLGRLDEAFRLNQEAYSNLTSIYPGDHAFVAIALSNLGRVKQDAGDFDSGEAYYKEALSMWERLHGPVHRDVGITLYRIGGLNQERGDRSEARAYFQRAHDIFVTVLGDEHPYVERTRTALASE